MSSPLPESLRVPRKQMEACEARVQEHRSERERKQSRALVPAPTLLHQVTSEGLGPLFPHLQSEQIGQDASTDLLLIHSP